VFDFLEELLVMERRRYAMSTIVSGTQTHTISVLLLHKEKSRPTLPQPEAFPQSTPRASAPQPHMAPPFQLVSRKPPEAPDVAKIPILHRGDIGSRLMAASS
jgi:hypothetical protein